jgi:hypothetical protein
MPVGYCTKQFTWQRTEDASSRLDRVYLPPLLESCPHLGHHTFLLRLGFARPGVATTASSSFNWKLNSAVLSDPDFFR